MTRATRAAVLAAARKRWPGYDTSVCDERHGFSVWTINLLDRGSLWMMRHEADSLDELLAKVRESE